MSFETHSGNSDIFAAQLEDTDQKITGYLKGVQFQKSKFGKDQPVLLMVSPKDGSEMRVVTAGSLTYTGINIAIGLKVIPYKKEEHEKNLDNIKKDKGLVGKLIRISHTGRFKNKAGQQVHKFKIEVDQRSSLEEFEKKLKASPIEEDTFNNPTESQHQDLSDIPF